MAEEEQTPSQEVVQDNTIEDTVSDEPVETIEQLAKSILIREPRPMFQQVIVSLGFVLGPLMLLLDIFFPQLFGFLPFSGLFIFIPSTILFFLASVLSAKRYS